MKEQGKQTSSLNVRGRGGKGAAILSWSTRAKRH